MRVRDGGGVLLTQAIHTLDLLLHLVGPHKDVDGFISSRAVQNALSLVYGLSLPFFDLYDLRV
jgi:predicted dehydrogenase